jgi:uncharacterized membrane protein
MGSTISLQCPENIDKKFIERFSFIDFSRGIVMIIMAWDHVSGFWNRYHGGGEGILGRAPTFVNTTWFLSRFITHYCAPTFIFLAGTVLAISSTRRLRKGDSEKQVSLHLIKRGLVLLFLEATLVSPAFSLPWTYFGVIACIGVCIILFSIARKLPTNLIPVLGLFIVLNHSFLHLNFIPTGPNWGWYLRVILHEPNFERWPYFGLYPIIPWIGVISLGWAFGNFLELKTKENIKNLSTPLFITGILSIISFFIIRYLNGYGNLLLRRGNSLVDWLYVSKYPPSVAFLLWTLGGMCFIMGIGILIENRHLSNNAVISGILTIGRNPLFFYIVHLWLYRARWPDFAPTNLIPPFYLSLPETILFWVVGILVLWYLCKEYEKLKRKYPKPILQYI